MECDNSLLVQAEFDGELDAAQTLHASQHRQRCAACRATYAQLSAERKLLREGVSRYRAPEALRRAISTGLDVATQVAPPVRNTSRPGWWRNGASFVLGNAMAACVALLVIVPAQQTLLDDVVASHVRALQPGHLEDVVSTSQHTVKPWFDGRIDFAPPVKDLAEKQFPLLGGRLDYLDGRAVAALIYGSDKHLIDLYVWPSGRGNGLLHASARKGYNTVSWSENGMNFWAVSDLEASKLADFVSEWRASP